MSLANALWSAVVSAVVSGIVVYTFQQWLQGKIRRFEAALERERGYEKHSTEMLVSSYKRVWEDLVHLEHWVAHTLPGEIGRFEGEELIPEILFAPYFETYNSLRVEMLFLPDGLYDRTSKVIIDLETGTNVFLAALDQALAARARDPDDRERIANRLSEANRFLNEIQDSYPKGLNSLRHDYQRISRDLLLGKEGSDRSPRPDQVINGEHNSQTVSEGRRSLRVRVAVWRRR